MIEILNAIAVLLGGVLAISGLIIAKKPDAKQLIDKLSPYQAMIGVAMVFLGVINFVRVLPYLSDVFKVNLLFAAATLAMLAVSVLLGALFVGSHVLFFFGLTVPVLRIAGGLAVAAFGWRVLSEGTASNHEVEAEGAVEAFYPLTLPLTVGPGSISVAIALGTQRPRILDNFQAGLTAGLGAVAPYAVSMAYRVRFYMDMNAREAMHLIELRTAPQGHPAYRRICQAMHTLIADQAGHRAIAGAMTFVDHSTVELERLKAERLAEQKRQRT